MRRLTLSLFCLLLSAAIWGQGSIQGKLYDTAARAPLSLATVTIFRAADTALVTYRLSTPEGSFRVTGLPLNTPLRAVISFSGYDAYRHEFTLAGDTPLDLGTINMNPSARSLDEVLVVAERPPVTVRRDTIEFNASSFKTLPTSLVEDLLKKLPGVQVDRDGNITANGRRVNRILMDGKSFFGDDPKMATRNLPANVIDKIQVTEDKDEAARNTDGDLTNIGQVINLTLKKGVKKGWFGKVYGGGGTKERYEAGGIANIYRDTMQLSLLGFSNNVNRSGFSMREVQDLGGFNRSGFSSMMISRRGNQEGFAINGISFGGLEPGIARSTGAGFNLNHAPNKKNTFFVQYFFGNNRNRLEETNNTQQFFNDTTVNSRTLTENAKNALSHNVSLGTSLKPDSLTDINFRSGYSYTTNDEDILAAIRVTSNKAGEVSSGEGKLFNNTYHNDYYHNLFVTRRFRAKKGRTLNLSHFLNYRNNLQRYITESDLEYYVPTPDVRLFEQLRRQDIPTLSATSNLAYAEPIAKNWTVRINGRYEYLNDRQDITIYDKDGSTLKYDLPDMSQSSGFNRVQNRLASYLTFSYKWKQVTLTAGAGGLWQEIRNEFRHLSTPVNIRRFDLLPTFSFNWKQMSFRYDQNVSAPAISHLIPVPDSTNPFFIRFGNPYLRPARRNSIYFSNFSFLQASGTNYNFYLNGSIINDDVVLSRRVAANGVQSVRPVNADGTIQLYAGVGFGKEFKKNPKFIYSFRFNPYMNFNRQKIIVNENVGTATNISYGPSFSMNLNWNDKVEFRPEYRPGVSIARYTDPSFPDLNAVVQYLESELIVRWPKNFVWETNLGYRYSSNVPPGLPKENVLWNAALTLLMLKDQKGMLKLSVYDLLNRNNSIYRYTTQNQIIDLQTNVLQRYALLTFTYNIRNMGAPKKVGGRDRLFLF